MPNTWNQSGTTWNEGRWGTQEAFTSGWGVDAWNTGGSWGQATDEVAQLTGQSITASLGEPITGSLNGWGRDTWNGGPYGESDNPTVTLSGQSITSSVGSITAFPEQGWGRDTWNFESWGFSGLTVELDGQSITSNLGVNGWSNASYGDNGWGMFTLNPADVVGLSGQQITSAVPPQFDIPEQVQGLSITSSVGSITPDQMSVGISGQSVTSSVGSISPSDVVGLSGQSIAGSIGSVEITTAQIIDIDGITITSTIGSITPDQMSVGLSGLSRTLSVGSISPADVVGLTGQQITSSVAGFGASTGFGIQAYQDVDTGVNITYSDVAQEKIMASTFTGLGVELQATGENAGTWGTKTNTNLQLLEQIAGGFTQQAVSDSGDTDLSVSDGSTGATLAHRMIEFTGSLSAGRNVTIPIDVQTFYFLKNSTSGSQDVTFKYVSGSGSSVAVAPSSVKIVFASANDGTNPDIIDIGMGDVTLTGTQTLTNKTLTSPKIGTSINDTNGNESVKLTATSSAVNEFTIANAATGNDPTLSATGGDTNIDIAIVPKGSGETVFGTGSAAATITTSGAHDLVLDTNSGTNSGTITITDGANGNITIAPNGTGVAQAVDGGDNTAAIKIAGKETIWVPAVAMYPNTTNGCADIEQVELSNGPELKVLDFDKDSDEFAQFAVAFPKSWNEGTITFQAFFTATSTDTGTTSWALQGVALADNGDLNTAFGTAVAPTAKAHSGTSNDLDVTAESGAVTIAGSPSTDEYVFFQISRDVSADSLNADARLLGIKIFFTTDAANDA